MCVRQDEFSGRLFPPGGVGVSHRVGVRGDGDARTPERFVNRAHVEVRHVSIFADVGGRQLRAAPMSVGSNEAGPDECGRVGWSAAATGSGSAGR